MTSGVLTTTGLRAGWLPCLHYVVERLDRNSTKSSRKFFLIPRFRSATLVPLFDVSSAQWPVRPPASASGSSPARPLTALQTLPLYQRLRSTAARVMSSPPAVHASP